MPPRALAKTHLPSSSEAKAFLIDRIGQENLETEYGGTLSPLADFRGYVEQGYWHVRTAGMVEAETDEGLSGLSVAL